MNIFSVYKVTNLINGKLYIGVTTLNPPKRRWQMHCCRARNKTSNIVFHHAIRKHGQENFLFEVIYQSQDSQHILIEMEPYFITKYDSYNTGYNKTKGRGGSWGCHPSEETKAKTSAALLGKKKTKEHAANISKAFSQKWLVTFPDGHKEEITNMTQFCKDHNLWPQNMGKVAKGILKSCAGFTCSKIED